MKNLRIFLTILLIALSMALFSSCSGSGKTICVGQVIDWSFEYEGDVSDLTISAVNEGLAEVVYFDSDGKGTINAKIRGIGNGKTSIKASSSVDEDFERELELTIQYEDLVYIEDGSLCQELTLSNTSAEIYKDDLTVTYTIKTSSDVDKITLSQLESTKRPTYYFEDIIDFIDTEGDIITLNTLTLDKSMVSSELVYNDKGQAYSLTLEQGTDSSAWTVKWNLGNTAVKFVKLDFIDTEGNETHTAYAKCDIHFPRIDVSKGIQPLIATWVKYNLDEPLFFEIDTRTLSAEQRKTYFELGKPEEIFDSSLVSALDGTSEENLSLPHIKNQVLASYPSDRITFMLYYDMSDEERATIAYKNGFSIDKSTFPFAYDILNQSRLIIPSIVTEEASAFEIERMLYSWMVKSYFRDGGLSSYYPIGAEDKCQSTAYGFINGYVCNHFAWSSTFKMLCDMIGIPCSIVNVQKTAGGACDSISADYTINIVRLGEEYYIVDSYSFWQKDEPTDGDYRFFNLTADMASAFYSWIGEGDFNPDSCIYSTYLVDEKTCELLSDIK